MNIEKREELRMAVRFFYDLQKLRIQTGNRSVSDTADLEADDQGYLAKASDTLQGLEKDTLKEVQKLLKGEPIYQWLDGVKGCGPTMSGVIVSEIDITKAPAPSSLWAYAGLAVDSSTGKAVRRKKGEKANWNPFLKTKLVGVLADCIMRANDPVYRKVYDDYKHRLETTVGACGPCEESGKVAKTDDNGKKVLKAGKSILVKCKNCQGTGRGPWGNSLGHRHNAAKRYMIKMFLLHLYNEWRTLEELPVREPYTTQYQDRKHHEHQDSAARV